MPQVLVFLANGFEEIEALTVIDILRRAQFEVTTAGLAHGPVMGAHQVAVLADTTLEQVQRRDFDMLVLPGGLGGAQTLRRNEMVQAKLKAYGQAGKWIGAICAAPMALAQAGLLEGKTFTHYPGALGDFPTLEGSGNLVEQDGTLITARGPGAALDFALCLVEVLGGKALRQEIEAPLLR